MLAELRRLLPSEDIIYYADSAHFPYGSKRPDAIRARAEDVTRELLALDAKIIVVACNTATSAAIAHLRETFEVPFVGMEPALKPAAERTLAGRVALLVTPGTAAGEKLSALIDRYGAEVTVRIVPAPDLAERVEAGDLDGDATRALVRRYVAEALAGGADVLALGCTHYAFLRAMIEEEAGDARRRHRAIGGGGAADGARPRSCVDAARRARAQAACGTLRAETMRRSRRCARGCRRRARCAVVAAHRVAGEP